VICFLFTKNVDSEKLPSGKSVHYVYCVLFKVWQVRLWSYDITTG